MNAEDRSNIRSGLVEHKTAALESKMAAEHHHAQANTQWEAANNPNLPVKDRILAGTTAVAEKAKEGASVISRDFHNNVRS